ncbi:MAG: hypothetical protein HY867_18025 [Chloroflexi bacterium]|nr:hypothetical protein [Chloroflexota bacterium]
MNSEIFVLFLFGAPAGILTSLLAAFGVWKKKIIALVIAGIWSVPAAFYLSAENGRPFYFIALFVFGAAVAVYRNKIRIAWLLLIPLFTLAAATTALTVYNIYINNLYPECIGVFHDLFRQT